MEESQNGEIEEGKEERNQKDEVEYNNISLKLIRLGNAIDIARNCGFGMTNSHLKYMEARTLLKGDDLLKAEDKIWEVRDQLFTDLEQRAYFNVGKLRVWTRSFILFKAKVYGALPLIYSLIVSFFFIGLLLRYPDTDPNSPTKITEITLGYLTLPLTVIGVPIWAAIIGGIGACAQIFWRLSNDVYFNGVVSEENQLQYIILPFMSPIFGYIAYILMDLGVMALGGSASDAAVSLENIQFQSRIIVCFLAGFATNKFLEKLNAVTEKF